jgi:hypothetical protein
MRKQDIGALALRLGALYCLLQSLPYLGNVLHYLAWPSMPKDALAMPALAAVLLLVAARLLQSCARPWGRRLAGPDPEAVVTEQWTAAHVQAIAFCTVGIYLVAEYAPALIAWLVKVLCMAAIVDRSQPRALDPAAWYAMGEEIVGTALGVWLFLGVRGAANLWRQLRAVRTAGGNGYPR